MKKRYKKAQFYLITVVLLVSLFIVFASTYNFVKRDSRIDTNDLKEEINFEILKTMEYIAFQELTDTDARTVLESLANVYIEKFGDDKTSFFIYGTGDDLRLKGFRATEENITVQGENFDVEIGEEFGPITYTSVNNFEIGVGDIENSFEIKEGQSFYYLMHYESQGGDYIVLQN